jgi:hypothetical protein
MNVEWIMRFLLPVLVCLVLASPAFAQNAAEKILSDPAIIFDSAKFEEAAAEELQQKWAADRKEDQAEKKQAAKAARMAPATAVAKPKRTWNQSRQVSPTANQEKKP